MINELYGAHTAMKNAGIVAPSWHRHMKIIPRYPTYFLMITESNEVEDIIPVDEKRKRMLRKWEPANGESFPAFNAPQLFKPLEEESMRRKYETLKKTHKKTGIVNEEDLREFINNVYEDSAGNWNSNTIKKLEKCLHVRPKNLVDLTGAPPPEFSSLEEIVNRSCNINLNDLFEALLELVRDKILNRPNESLNWIDNLLIGKNNVTFVLELADTGRFDYPANHPKVLELINNRLLEGMSSEAEGGAADVFDAFGEPLIGKEPKFPDMNLPVLGNVKLRSMFGEIQCQYRYGQAEADSYPLNESVRQGLKVTMEWLMDRDRKGVTWQTATRATDYNAAVLIAFPSEMPKIPPQMAAMIGGVEESASDELSFENLSSAVVKSLEGIVKEKPHTTISVFVLAKADKARSKLVSRMEFSALRLIESADRWKLGIQNLPEFGTRINLGKTLTEFGPVTPFPVEVVALVKTKWIRGGEASMVLKGERIVDGINLLIGSDHGERDVALNTLRVIVDRAGPLLLRLGHSDNRNGRNIKISTSALDFGRKTLGLIGILLFKLNHMKGDYMQGAPFLVGRILKLSDLIHREYCKIVRQNQIPPQLVGNALIPAALDNPQAGLARLFERLRVYQAWASTVKGEDTGLARWFLKQLELTSEELSRLELPTRCDDAAKAQMMLGYLARIPSDKNKTNEKEAE